MCPASGQLCNVCQKKGHFARVCLSKNTAGKESRRHHAHQVGQFANTDHESDSDYVFSLPKSAAVRPTVKVTINGVKGRMDADSCSSANIMDIDQYNAIAKASTVPMQLQPADNRLYAYAQTSPINLAGKFTANICSLTTGTNVTAEFLVVQSTANSRPLLSLETGVQLGVIHITNQTKCTPKSQISLQEIVDEYLTVFNGLGLHKTVKAKLIVDNSVTPIAQKNSRRIPYNFEKKVEEEQRLMGLGIIEEVPDSEPTT